MLTEIQEEQASLYALDMLEGQEVSAFQREMLAKPELQVLVEDLRLCRDVLVLESSTVPAPPALKEKIIGQFLASIPAPASTAHRYSLSRLLLPWALVACLLVVAGGFALEQKQMQQEFSLMETRLQEQEESLAKSNDLNSRQAQTITQLESQNLLQAGTIAQLKATSAQANPWTQSTVSVVWDKNKQQGFLVLAKMPVAESGKVYQLWVIDPDAPGPVSAGTFEVQPDGTARIIFRPSSQVNQAAQFAVSLEQGGEKQQPEGPVILAGTSL